MINPNPITIRLAQFADTSEIADLCGQLGYPTTQAQASLRLGNLLSRPDHAIFIAEIPGYKIVGWVHVFTMHHLESDTLAEIGGLVVDEAWRGQEIGKALIQAAMAWASTQQVTSLRVHSNIIRLRAHEFYDELGFERQKTQHVFIISLPA